MATKKAGVAARGTPHQWAYANVLAKGKGLGGVGKAMRTLGASTAKPASFKAGIKQMSDVIRKIKRA